jgi:extracellular factor (EF) 3-hydroxypalmitic acid methyl ester biosynthesis protein
MRSAEPAEPIVSLTTQCPPFRQPSPRIASVLGRYAESQSRFAILPESARHAVLGIGDRMQGLQRALRAVEPGCDGDPGTDYASESLVAAALHDAVDPGLGALQRQIGFAAPVPWRVASRYFHERFGALVDHSPFAARCLHKPLGYAGDFEMMNMIYRNESLGGTLFGRALSRVVLDSDAARAVRAGAHYLVAKIEAAAALGGRHRPARVLSVGAGPAVELQLVLLRNPALLAAGRAEITLLDHDAGALAHARGRIQALAEQADVEVTLRCVNTSIKAVITEGLDDSYDLVYSVGLFDHLKDLPVRAAGTRLVDALAPGGHAVIGNFDVANPTRPFMELILDWPLYHRSADDLRRLFDGLGTGISIEREATGVNLFAVMIGA